MTKRAYELNEEEQAIVEGLRRGRVTLHGQEWVCLSEKEREAIEIMRQVGHGPVTFQMVDGQPMEMEATVHARLGKENETRLELVQKLRS